MKSIIKEKRCCLCKIVKPIDMYYRSCRNKDGRAYRCRECISKINRQYNQTHGRKKNKQEYRKKCYQNPKYREEENERARKRRKKLRLKKKQALEYFQMIALGSEIAGGTYWKGKYDRLTADLAEARKEVEALSLIVLKVDHYCRVNDIDMEQFLKGK